LPSDVRSGFEQLGSVERAIDVLFHLHALPAPAGVTAIGRALGLPKSSAHRLLSALGRRGLVERDERGRYRTGVALVALGLGVLEREPVVLAAQPVLEEEADALGETVFLVGARARQLVVLAKAEGSGFLRASPRVGAVVPVHATAVGKLYLAFAPDELGETTDPLTPFTPQTVEDARALERAVTGARRRGWSESREEWIPGLSVIAAPVVHAGRMAGAVALAASTPRFDELGGARLAPRVVAAADRIAARLEGRPAEQPRARGGTRA
jgi:IclR family acetate operon transcriptional repressor